MKTGESDSMSMNNQAMRRNGKLLMPGAAEIRRPCLEREGAL